MNLELEQVERHSRRTMEQVEQGRTRTNKDEFGERQLDWFGLPSQSEVDKVVESNWNVNLMVDKMTVQRKQHENERQKSVGASERGRRQGKGGWKGRGRQNAKSVSLIANG
jgi:hypothetical protein